MQFSPSCLVLMITYTLSLHTIREFKSAHIPALLQGLPISLRIKIQVPCDGPCDLVPSELILYHSHSLTVFQPHWPFSFSDRPKKFCPASELLQCCSLCLEDFSISVWVSFFSLLRSLFKYHLLREAFLTNLSEVLPPEIHTHTSTLYHITMYFWNIACHNTIFLFVFIFYVCFHITLPPTVRSLRLLSVHHCFHSIK